MGAKGGGLYSGLGNQDFGPRTWSRLGKGLFVNFVFFFVKCFSAASQLSGKKAEKAQEKRTSEVARELFDSSKNQNNF